MIFLPRETPEGEYVAEDKSAIRLDVRQSDRNAYELTSPKAKQLSDYQSILQIALQVSKPEDRLCLGIGWREKRNCLIIITDDIETKLKNLAEKGEQMDYREIGKPYELTNEFIRERMEFEGIADLIVECIIDPDSFYLCYDWKKRKNAIFWATDQPDKRQECVTGKSITLVPAN